MSKLRIPVTLTSGINEPVVEASEVKDVSFNKNQSKINEDTSRAIGNINNLVVGEDNLVDAINVNSNSIVTLDETKANKVDVQTALDLKANKTDLNSYVNDASYDSNTKRIDFKHDSTILASIDATDFIKDGMVSNVTIENGYLVITFNTDSGQEPIRIALTDIFNPDNYYTKNVIDSKLGSLEFITGNNNVTDAVNTTIRNLTTGLDNLNTIKADKSTVNDLAQEVQDKYDSLNSNKANIDGSYDSMAVGIAKNLEGRKSVEDSFFERTTGGEAEVANGVAQLEEIQGNTGVVNQLASFTSQSKTENGITYTPQANGKVKVSGTASDTVTALSIQDNPLVGIASHKYFLKTPKTADDHFYIQWVGLGIYSSSGTGIYTCTAPGTLGYDQIRVRCAADAVVDYEDYIMAIDLTLMYGAGNEPTTVEQFEQRLKDEYNLTINDYIAYTQGKLVNVAFEGIESTGRNLLDPTTNKARILGIYSDDYDAYYGITGTYSTLTFVSDKGETTAITPDSEGKFLIEESGYLTVANPSDCCVFLWWDGSKTDYVDYNKEVAYLDVKNIWGKAQGSDTLVQVWPDGMPKVDNIGDILKVENGEVVAKRNVGRVDLGTWNWMEHTLISNGYYITAAVVKPGSALLCAKYVQIPTHSWGVGDKEMSSVYNNVVIKDSAYSDVASFKAAMNGVILNYELATPIIYTDLVYKNSPYFADGTPVVLPMNYKVDNWGMERILPQNTSEDVVTAKPIISCKYSIDAIEDLDTLHTQIDNLDEKKPNKEGIYDGMVVGAAKAIAGNQRVIKDATYFVVDAATGIAKVNEVMGRSEKWNQIWTKGTVMSGNSAVIQYDSSTDTYNISHDAGQYYFSAYNYSQKYVAGHKYWVNAKFTSTGLNHVRVRISEGSGPNIESDKQYLSQIITVPTTASAASLSQFIIFGFGTADVAATLSVQNLNICDLTDIYGEGNEPTTVEQFEADVFAKYGKTLDEYFAYDAGSINNANVESIKVYDDNNDLRTELPINIKTITGKINGEGESVTIFPNGMRGVGSAYDSLIVDEDGWCRRAIVRMAIQDLGASDMVYGKSSGGTYSFYSTKFRGIIKSNTTNKISDKFINGAVSGDATGTMSCDAAGTLYFTLSPYTDVASFKAAMQGVSLIYELKTPIEYVLDEPILMTFNAYNGGVIRQVKGDMELATRINITFAIDAVGILNGLPQNYISADSMDAFLAKLSTAMGGTWTKTWDATTQKYNFTFVSNS